MQSQENQSEQPSDNEYSEYVTSEEEGNNQNSSRQNATPRYKLWLRKLLNPYLLGLMALIIIAGSITWFAKTSNESTIDIDGSDVATSTLTEDDFTTLAQEQAEIDSTNKLLNVRANSVFDGTMLVKSSLEVQGQLQVGEKMTLNDLIVSGQSTFNNLDLSNDLNVQGQTQLNGSTTIQNDLSVSNSLNVAGGGTFAGNLTANSIEAGDLSFSGDLNMNGHIVTGGAQTSASSGNSVGSGGTASVNGNDTAGTVNVSTGGSPSAGILANVQFGSAYGSAPSVNITPVGSSSGNLDWYVTRTPGGFKIGASSAPSGGSNYSFDYFIVE